MSSPSLLSYLGYVDMLLCVIGLCVITARRLWPDYWAVGSLLAVRVLSDSILSVIHFLWRGATHRGTFYSSYFYVYWFAFSIEAVLALLIIYSTLRFTLGPLRGLQRLVKTIFCITSGVGLLAVGFVITRQMSGTELLIAAVSQLQRTQSLVTLCVAIILLFALRPMGLSFRSSPFGIGLGLGLMSLNDLLQAGWLALRPFGSHSLLYLVNGLVVCSILLLWTAYLAMPEPKRGAIASPLLRWNEKLIGAA